MQTFSDHPSFQFQPSQIICLENENSYLYAEVIDIVEDRQLCWSRPLLLALWPDARSVSDMMNLYDLRQGADLVLPIQLFRPAIDTEIISLLGELESSKTQSTETKIAQQMLSNFIQKVWRSHRSAFQSRLTPHPD